MPVGLQKLMTRALSDQKISEAEVKEIITHVRSNNITSAAEKKQIKELLTQHASKFEGNAAVMLRQLLETPTDPAHPTPDTPQQMMTVKLDAAKEGGISGQELQTAEKEIAAKYGAKVAKEVMLASIAMTAEGLTIDAVEWLQAKYGKMDGHIDNFQRALLTHLSDAKLLDANFDGKLDSNDLIFTKDASGKINVQKVGDVLRDRIRIGAAMIDACQSMNNAHHEFALLKDHKFNSKYWEPVSSESPTFEIKKGVKPSDAVQDMFDHPKKYQFECATALVIVYYKAMLELLGPKDFDAACPNLQIGPWQYESTLSGNLDRSGSGSSEASDARKGELKAGDYTYFKNWDVSDKGRDEGWQGENVISLGKGEYYGHPFGVSTDRHIIDYLNMNRNLGSTRSAGMLNLQMRLSSDVLKYDKNPDK